MNIENINQELPQLKTISSNIDSVCLGRKIQDGKVTDEISVVFTVEEKIPLDKLPENEIIPNTVDVDGVTLTTDVVKKYTLSINACPTTFNSTCVQSPVPNMSRVRPLKGGLSIRKTTNGTGTLGFFAKHTPTGALVGVSNAHVLKKYPLSANHWCTSPGCITNYSTLEEYVYQPGESSSDEIESNKIGRVMYSYPLKTSNNEVDVAIIGILNSVVSNSESYKQLGLSFTNVPPFATTSEINSILTNNIELAASGRSTGAKEGNLCGLKLLYSDYSVLVGDYSDNEPGYEWTLPFINQMVYTRANSECPNPSIPGDSGSAVLGKFGSTWKIVGLNFAGGSFGDVEVGVFNRIDKVAEYMQIESWNGTTLNFINTENPQIAFVAGQSSSSNITLSGQTFWQAGLG
jgi:hypothetical protein